MIIDLKIQSDIAAKLEVGDVITALCECLQIKRGMCQMKGTFSKFVRKGTKLVVIF